MNKEIHNFTITKLNKIKIHNIKIKTIFAYTKKMQTIFKTIFTKQEFEIDTII